MIILNFTPHLTDIIIMKFRVVDQYNKTLARHDSEQAAQNYILKHSLDDAKIIKSQTRADLNNLLIDKVNQIGQKSDPPFHFVRELKERDSSERMVVVIRNVLTNQEIDYSICNVFDGFNPWRDKKHKYSADTINQIGQSSSPKFCYLGEAGRYEKQKSIRLVELLCIESGEVKTSLLSGLAQGHNPFNTTSILVEHTIVHPLIKKSLLDLQFTVRQEVNLINGSRVDFVATSPKGQEVIIEAKCDKGSGCRWTKREIETQRNTYQAWGLRVCLILPKFYLYHP